MQKTLDSLNSKAITAQNNILEQKQKIEEQSVVIKNQRKESETQLKLVEDQKQLLADQHSKLIHQKDSINNQINKIKSTEKLIAAQKGDLEKGRTILYNQQIDIRRMDTDIQNKTTELNHLS